MRIKQADLPAFIEQTLLNIRLGVQNARSHGLQADLPKKIEFQVEVIQSPASLTLTTTAAVNGARESESNKPEVTETSTKSGGGQTTRETATDAGVRLASTQKKEAASDTVTSSSNQTSAQSSNSDEQSRRDKTYA